MTIAAWLTFFCVFVCFYHFVGYPVLLWVATKFWPNRVKKKNIQPTVSILIAAFNEETVIREKLASCLNLDYPAQCLEIIVISDGSTDSTNSIVSEFSESNVKLLINDTRQGKSFSLNRAVEAATGEILLVSDANAMLDRASLRILVSNFADSSVGCVNGCKRMVDDLNDISDSEGLYWRYESAIKQWESTTGSTMGVYGAILAIRRDLYEPIPNGLINDDFFIALTCMEKGQRVVYEADAICLAYASRSTAQDRIRRSRISAGRFQILIRTLKHSNLSAWNWIKLISHKYLRLFLIVFLVGAFIANLVAVVQAKSGVIIVLLLIGQIVFLGLALLGAVLERSGRRSTLPSVAYYIVSGALSSLEGIYGYLRGRQTVIWQKVDRGSGRSSE